MAEVHAIRLAEDDDVAVMVAPARAGDAIAVSGPGAVMQVEARQDIPRHHKVALIAAPVGRAMRRGGVVIGALTAAVGAGELVHVHNLKSLRAKPAE